MFTCAIITDCPLASTDISLTAARKVLADLACLPEDRLSSQIHIVIGSMQLDASFVEVYTGPFHLEKILSAMSNFQSTATGTDAGEDEGNTPTSAIFNTRAPRFLAK